MSHTTPEQERLAAVAASGLLRRRADATFDRAARTVARCTGAPVALVSVVAEEAQHFVGQVGLQGELATSRSTPRSSSVCQYVAANDNVVLIEDAGVDDLVAGLVPIPDLALGAYLGVPLRDPDGVPLGAVCAIDAVPRSWSGEDVASLADVAGFLQAHLTLRSTTHAMTELARDVGRPSRRAPRGMRAGTCLALPVPPRRR